MGRASRLRFAVLVALLALILSAETATRASADPPQPRDIINIGNPIGLPLTPAQEAQDIRFREAFGFNSDRTYIESLYQRAASGLLPGASRNWATLLTADEAAEMITRQGLKEIVGPTPAGVTGGQPTAFGAYVAAHASEFGGQYFDQSAGGAITVLFTENIDAHRLALSSILGAYKTRLRVVQALHTYDELRQFTAQVTSDVGWLKDHGVVLSSFGPDVATDTVALRVPAATPAVLAVLQGRYPNKPWRVEVAPLPSTLGENATEAPPMMGALGIYNNVVKCTSGFMVQNVINGSPGGTHAVIGAGHCFDDSPWHQGNGIFGLGDYFVGSTSIWQFGHYGDAEIIPLQTQTDASHNVYISTTSCGFLCTSHNVRTMQNYEGVTSVGEVTCYSLSNEGNEFCGSVTNTDQCVFYADPGIQVCNQVFTWLTASKGDSGGPAYQPQPNGTSLAQGILSGTLNSGGSNYTQIAAAFNMISAANGGTWVPE